MNRFLLQLILISWLFAGINLSAAQTPRPDVLYKIDRTSVNVKIDELTDTDIIYFEPLVPKVKKTIARSQVWKIVFSDGSIEIVTVQPGDASTNQAASQAKPTNSNAPIAVEANRKSTSSGDYSAPSASASYTNPTAFARIHLTVGPEFAYYPDMLNKDKAWLNDSTGFGMKNNIGASLRFDYQFIHKLAVSVTAGYYGWELVRKYTRDGITEYNETKRLTQIPVQIGLKFYPISSFYLMPEGGVNLLFASVKTSDNHPTPANESVQSTPITYGASLGYEIRAKALLLDLSVRYQILNVNNLNYAEFKQNLNEHVNIASIRLGIGFNSFKK